ncbi:hypothetical protein HDU67_004478 [Dinochytrium kinnereticum]|nr:hypothetical protein HDU67_004478 [Dinochytrium kinnereticum]
MKQRLSLEQLQRIFRPYTGGGSPASILGSVEDAFMADGVDGHAAANNTNSLSLGQRLTIAKDIWADYKTHIPRKAVMILEWVNSVMLYHASAAAAKEDKAEKVFAKGAHENLEMMEQHDLKHISGSSALPHMTLDCWRLMDEILRNLSQSRRFPGSSHFNTIEDGWNNSNLVDKYRGDMPECDEDLVESDGSPIRLPGFFTTIGVMLQSLARHIDLVQNEKGMDVDALQDGDNQYASLLLRTAHSCLKSLLSKALVHDVLRPTLDNYVSLTSHVLESLAEMQPHSLKPLENLPWSAEMDNEGLASRERYAIELLSLSLTLSSTLHDALLMAPNQKKVFASLAVSKFIFPLLRIHHGLSCLEVDPEDRFYRKSFLPSTQPPLTILEGWKRLRGYLILIIDEGLLHHEHISDFVGVVKQLILAKEDKGAKGPDRKKRDSTKFAYPKKIFDVIREGLDASGEAEYVRAELCTILDRFLAIRTIQASHPHAIASLETEAFSFGFSVFSVFYNSLSSLESEKISVISSMLARMLARNVYRRTRDASSEFQLVVLKSVCRDLVQSLESDSVPCNDGPLFSGLTSILEMDMNIILEFFDRILPCLVQKRGSPISKERKEFLISLIRTMSKAHDLDQLLMRLVVISEEAPDENFSYGSIIIERDILAEFRACISRALPAEVVGLISFIVDTLTPLGQMIGNTKAKRARLTSSKEQASNSSANSSVADLCAIFLDCILQSARLPPSHQSIAENMLCQLHEVFALACLNPFLMLDGESDKLGPSKRSRTSDGEDFRRFLFPSLTVLLASMHASERFCRKLIKTPFVESVVSLTSDDLRVEYIKVQIALFHIGLVANTSVDPRLDGGSVRLVRGILNSVYLPDNISSECVWDGSISSLIRNPNAIIVAKWSSVLDNLAPICRLASEHQLRNITTLILQSLSENCISGDVYNVAELCKSALRSASFFEIRPIRDAIASVFLEVLIVELGKISSIPKSIRQSITVFLNACQKSTSTSEVLRDQLQKLCEELLSQNLKGSLGASIESDIRKILRYIGTMAIFPTSYFLSSEKDFLICIGVALDALAQSLLKLSDGENDAILELSAQSRIEVARLFRSRDDSVIMISSPFVPKVFFTVLELPAFKASNSSAKGVIVQATSSILELCLIKLLQRRSSNAAKGALAALTYLKEIIDIPLSYLQSHGAFAYHICDAILSPIGKWIEALNLVFADDFVEFESEITSKMFRLLVVASKEQFAQIMSHYILAARRFAMPGSPKSVSIFGYLYVLHILCAASQLDGKKMTLKKYLYVAAPYLSALLRSAKKEATNPSSLLWKSFSEMDEDRKESSSKTLSRVLQKFAQKQSIQSSAGLGGSGSQLKPFSKHAPFLISRFVSIQASKSRFSPGVYDALVDGIYSILDICDDYGRESVLANLDLPGTGQKGAKLIYKKIVKGFLPTLVAFQLPVVAGLISSDVPKREEVDDSTYSPLRSQKGLRELITKRLPYGRNTELAPSQRASMCIEKLF